MPWVWRYVLGLTLGLSALAAWHLVAGGGEVLLREFALQVDVASVRRPSPDVFTAEDVVITGISRRAITVSVPSRIAWDFAMPEAARLSTFIALREESWTQPGDGVLFRIGVSFDGRYEELLTRVLHPLVQTGDRGWVAVDLDLSPYVGKQVSLVLNTGAGLAVWGAPTLYGRR